MPRYIDADNFRKTMIKRFGCIPCLTDYSEASRNDIPIDDALNLAPTADVVPRSEVDLYRKQVDELEDELASTYDKLENAKAEIETLKDNNEHLAVILEETKAEVEKLQNELVIWKQNRFNLFQRLECYETARQKVASEIFAEIESKKMFLKDCVGNMGVVVLFKDISELEKKYTEGEDKPATEEKYFSPEDVRNMTPQEVREKYTAIRKSMERW